MPRKAGHADIADKIRGAAKMAIARLEAKDRGKGERTLTGILERCFEEQPLETIRALATWKAPETAHHEHTINVAEDATEALRRLNAAGHGEAVRGALRDSLEALEDETGDLRH